MENILNDFNGVMCGEEYLFNYNGKKFVARFKNDGAVDYGHRKIIAISSLDNEFCNNFKFKKGSYDVEGGVVRYFNDNYMPVIVTDFTDLTDDISNWLDFVTN